MALKSSRGEVSRKLRSEMDKRLEQSGIVISNQAKLFSPVDTGRLRGSIVYGVEGDTVRVGTNVSYAIHQEFGTRYQSGTPFLRPGINAARPALIALWSKPVTG